MISSNATEKQQKPTPSQKPKSEGRDNTTIVRVPIQMTLAVPVSIDIPPEEIIKGPSEVICDATVVDAFDNEKAISAVMTQLPENEMAITALASLQAAAFKLLVKYPDIRAYFTTFAGVIEEKEL